MKIRIRAFFQHRLSFLLLAPLAILYLWQFRGMIVDDAFITLQYAFNLGHSLHWGFLSDQISNTATSPLNVILTAIVGRLLPDMRSAAVVLASAESIILCGLLLAISHQLFGVRYFGIVSFVGLMANPLLMSTLGLESLLYVLLLVAALYFFLLRQTRPLAITLGLLTLPRPDGILLSLILLLALPVARSDPMETRPGYSPGLFSRLSPRLSFMFTYLITILPWYLFSWLFLGSFIPDTFFLKVANPWGSWDFAMSFPIYWSRYPAETLFSFWLVPCALLLLVGKNAQANTLVKILASFGVLYFAAYSLLRVAPFHWYLAPLAAATVLAGTLGMASFLNRFGRHTLVRLGSYAFSLAAGLGILVSFWSSGSVALAEAPFQANWASQDQYRQIGLWLKDHVDAAQKIKMNGEVGTIAYFSERQLYDSFGCRSDAAVSFHRFDQGGSFVAMVLGVNFQWLKPSAPCGPYAYELDCSLNPKVPLADPASIVMQWDVSSRWLKSARYYLRRLPVAPTVVIDRQAPLKIDQFGPTEAFVGQSFDEQPDGSSAFWFKTENAAPGLELVFDGQILSVAYGSPEFVAVPISTQNLGAPRSINMYLFDPVNQRKSNSVQFILSAASP